MMPCMKKVGRVVLRWALVAVGEIVFVFSGSWHCGLVGCEIVFVRESKQRVHLPLNSKCTTRGDPLWEFPLAV